MPPFLFIDHCRIQHLAQELRGNADVGGHLFLGQALYQGGVKPAKIMVPFHSGEAQVVYQPVLIGGE